MCHFNVKDIQISEFVRISELSDKIHCLASKLYTILFLHITIKELCGRPIILYMLICFSIHYSYYDIISLTSLKITQAFHLLLDFAENQRILKFNIVFG